MKRTRYFLIVVFAILIRIGVMTVSASECGRFPDEPIWLASDSVYFKSTAMGDATEWGFDCEAGLDRGRPIFFRVTLPRTMSLVVHTFGSELLCTGIEIDGPGYYTPPRARDNDSFMSFYSASAEWDDLTCARSQDCYVAFDLPPGEYEIRAFGKRYYNANPVNGPIRLTVIGFSDLSPSFPDIPQDYIPGTKTHPYKLGNCYSDFKFDVSRRFNVDYVRARPDERPEAWFEMYLGCRMNLTFASSCMSALAEIAVDSIRYVNHRADTISLVNAPAGRYFLLAILNEDLAVSFSVEGHVPPPPPDPDLYGPVSLYDESVVGKNYVSQLTYLDAGGRYVSEIGHVDGLGRPVQTVIPDGSPLGGSIMTRLEYDSCGRQTLSWLPVMVETSGSGHYTSPAYADPSVVYGSDARPFTEQTYEASMLARTVSMLGPGQKWADAGAAVTTEYDVNGSSGELACICFSVNDTPDSKSASVTVSCRQSYATGIYYAPGELTVVRTTDEDGRAVLSFTDPEGHEILTRCVIDGGYADTYYIYDTYGNLTAVLPPELSACISGATTLSSGESSLLDDYAYLYSYDALGQLVAKKLPGCDWVRFSRDVTGRVVLSQDGNLGKQKLFRFELVDAFGRPCLTGICRRGMFADYLPDSESEELENAPAIVRRSDDATALMGYKIEGVELIAPTVLTATYYDDYSALGQPFFAPTTVLDYLPAPDFGERCANVRGRVTCAATAIPVEAGVDSLTYLYSATYYDSRDRPIQTVATNHMGGTDRTLTAYDFAGRPLLSESIHTVSAEYGDSAIVQQLRRSFDDFGRELSVSHRLGREGDWTLLASNSYDAVGRLVATDRGGSPQLRTDLTLDIRSRPASITSSNYYQHLDFTPGGNVSSMRWWAKGTDERERRYDFTYDDLGRLTAADYSGTGDYSTAYTYDLNGNILTLRRSGLYSLMSTRPYRTVDDLTMTYSGNRLVSVSDAAFGPYDQGAHHFVDRVDEDIELTYDANGNTVRDLNRDLLLTTYDINNQPRRLEFADGSTSAYLYDAAGQRHRTLHRVAEFPLSFPSAGEPDAEGYYTVRTDYCGPFLYENARLTQIFVEGGYMRLRDEMGQPLSAPEYHFFLRDHLGNNRLDASIAAAPASPGHQLATPAVTIHQVNHYYPFGMPMDCASTNAYQRWLFGDKEFDRTHGLDLYDQAARQYDPITGRFRSPDPLAESFAPFSPYLFGAANPLINNDPTGEFLDTVWDVGNILYDAGAAIYNHATGDHETAKSHWVDAAADVAAALIPGVPAGTTKVLRAGAKASTKAATKGEVVVVNSTIRTVAKVSPSTTSVNNTDSKSSSLETVEKQSAKKEDAKSDYSRHTKGARQSTSDKHTKHRSGKQYGKNKNAKRGEKNRKYEKEPNPNKRDRNKGRNSKRG